VPATVVIRLNGAPREIPAGGTVADLLRELNLPVPGVAVEVNRTVVPRDRHAETRLRDGDRVEIVQFVGGG
jgi:thiamine biosynthesis protein ThiS